MLLTDAEWVFFDIGHTLVDENDVHAQRAEGALARLEEEGGPHHTLDEFFAGVYTAGKLGVKSPFVCSLKSLGVKKMPPYTNDLERPYPEAAAVLRAIHTKYKVGIITNQKAGTVRRLRQYGLLEHVDFVYSSTEIGKNKPSPEFYRSAIRAVGAEPGRCVMVGDRPDNDTVPAKACGMITVRVRQGFLCAYNTVLPEEIPDYDIPCISELPWLFGVMDEFRG